MLLVMPAASCLRVSTLSQISLSRHDLFHAHLFRASAPAGLGLLFHAVNPCSQRLHVPQVGRTAQQACAQREYPMLGEHWSIPLGNCQLGSTTEAKSMRTRNWIFFKARGLHLRLAASTGTAESSGRCTGQGSLACLDVGHGTPVRDMLVMEGYEEACTLLESDFGQPLADVNLFPSAPGQQLYVCLY